ncbi:MAG: hypothetical protein AAFO95_00450 [Cyanobacteria bacterium J06600_6]
METPSILDIGQFIASYILNLNWTYILSFILLAYLAIYFKRSENLNIPSRYLVALLGLLYGGGLAIFKSYNIEQIDTLLQSFLFALGFHKLLIEKLVSFIQRKLTAGSPE